jgi:predicted CXXCH cytochrome family protein
MKTAEAEFSGINGKESSWRVRQLASFIMCLVITLSIGGCAGDSGYKVLSFFFDGVPDPAEKKAAEAGKETGDKTASSSGLKYKASVHGPYAAKLCNGCHNRSTNALLMPLRELCFKCHEFNMEKKYVHGPLAAGGCTVCHDPHSSGNRFLLVSASENFCFHCHDKRSVDENAAHKGIQPDCTSCHSAHMSDMQYLLK